MRLTHVVVHEPELPRLSLSPDKVEQGRESVRSVVRERLSYEHLLEEHELAEGSLDRLVEASGSLLRDLVHRAWHASVSQSWLVCPEGAALSQAYIRATRPQCPR